MRRQDPRNDRGWFVYWHKDSTWVLRYRIEPGKWHDHRTPERSALRTDLRAMRRAERYAEAWIAEFRRLGERPAEEPVLAPDAGPLLKVVVKDWLAYRAAHPDMKENTRRAYEYASAHVVDGIGEVPVSLLDPDVLSSFVLALRAKVSKRTGRKLSPSSVRNVHVALVDLLEWCITKKFLAEPNPARARSVARELPKAGKLAGRMTIIHVTPAQAERLITCQGVPEVRRVKYLLAFTSGMRDGELCALTFDDLELDGGLVHVTKQLAFATPPAKGYVDAPTKSEASTRDLPLHPLALAALKAWKASGFARFVGRHPRGADRVFPNYQGKAARPKSATLMRDDLEAAEIGTRYAGKHLIDFHCTRRSFTSWLAAKGVPREMRTRLLGQTLTDVVEVNYTADSIEAKARAIALIELNLDRGKVVSMPVRSVGNSGPHIARDVAELVAERDKPATRDRKRSQKQAPREPPGEIRTWAATMRVPRSRCILLSAVVSFSSSALACGHEAPPPSVPPVTSASVAPVSPVLAPTAADLGLKGPDEASLDRSVSPCDDFYQFACGGWMKATPIPDDEASWVRSFSVIHEDNQKALREILDRDARGDTRGDAYGRELGDLWASCMDEEGIERRAQDELRPELKRVEGVRDPRSLIDAIAHLHSIGVGVAFGFDSEIDFKDATMMIAGVTQGGLGLPERDYYFRDDQRTKDIRAAYESHVARTLELLGEDPKQAAADAKTVMKVETQLAGASMTNVELRDPQKVYHRLDLAGLKKLAPDVAWDSYLAKVGFPGITAINVAQPDFVKELDAMTKSIKIADWRTYLRWHLGRGASPWLSRKFVDEWFLFRQVLTGTKVLQPRWKRCVRFADQMMGEALAQPFVKEHLGEDGKQAAAQMVEGIEASMRNDLASLAWMDEATRTKAEDKLARITNKIGYPAKWRSYDGLAIDRASFLANAERASAFEVKRELTKVGKPVDKEEWEMTPPTVNAYYEPTMNEMVFPAGILQEPFYGKGQTAALNFGAIGMVVGHELTHGFDDEGRQFDAEGNLRDWWTPAVSAEFDKRAACVERQFDEYVPIDDMHIKGKLTLGENIADLGGLRLSFAALQRAQSAAPAAPHGGAPVAPDGAPIQASAPMPSAGGFSPAQQFFVGFAQAWCANYRPEALRLLVSTNPHSPPKYRVDGPLSNLPEFASVFECKEGSPMVPPAAKRCEVW